MTPELQNKIDRTKASIMDYVEQFAGQAYVSFSGGKDSTVLLHIARSIYPDIEAVFCDTGLEFPEIRDFVKTFDNVTWLKPKIPFTKVIEKYGWPIVSKEQSQFITEARNTNSAKLLDIRMNGNKWKAGKIANKWKYLLDAPFPIGHKCCDVMKKLPAKAFEKSSGKHPIIGTMLGESQLRKQQFEKHGCNSLTAKRPVSKPMSLWSDEDVWAYIKEFDVSYSTIYDMGYKRTGCMFCLYGLHMEKGETRLDRLERTHPKIYEFCMTKLGMKQVLSWYPQRP